MAFGLARICPRVVTVIALAAAGLPVIAVPASAAELRPAGSFVAVNATRVLDTGTGLGAPRAAVRANAAVSLQVTGRGGVPSSGVATVLLNVVAVAGTASGTVTAYPAGKARPGTPNIYYAKGRTVANLVSVPVGIGGKITLFNGSTGSVRLIANVHGYTLAGTATQPGTYRAVTAARVLDTGTGLGAPRAAVRANAAVTLQVAGRGGVPSSGVATVLVNVVAVSGTASGTVTAYPAGKARPGTPNIYYAKGRTVANLVSVPVGIGGKITLFNGSAGTVRLMANVHGYTLAGTATQPGTYRAVTAARVLDTATGLGAPRAAVRANAAVTLQVTGRGGVPSSGVATVLLNVVAVAGTASGTVTAYPAGKARPGTPNIYYGKGQTVANLVSVPIGTGGKLTLFNGSTGTVRLIANVHGYTIHDTTAPGRVTNLTAGSVTETSVKLSWTNPADLDLTGVVVRRATGSTPPSSPTAGTAVADVAKPATTVTVTGLTAGTKYSFALFAHDGVPNHAAATTISATTAAADSPPGPVTELESVVMTQTTVSLAWVNPADADFDGVMIRRRAGTTPPTSSTDGSLVADAPASTTTYIDQGLVADSQYSYALFAHDAKPNFAPAATVTATTSTDTPAAVSRAIDVTAGSSVPVDLSGSFSRIVSLQVQPGGSPDLTLALTDAGAVTVAAKSSASSGAASIAAVGSACVEKNCGIAFSLDVTASISALADAPPLSESFTLPAPDRLARADAIAAGKALDDEVILTLGTPQSPGTLSEAQALAETVGAVVSGALEDLGVYELRWTTAPADLDAVLAQLSAAPGVAAASRSTFGAVRANATPPGDWKDDGEAVKWPFEQIRATQAWDVTTGGSTEVGIVDLGTVFRRHEDLNVTQTLGSAGKDDHATHVAGLACAVANGKGLVGASWGCPIVSSGLASTTSEEFDKSVLEAARQTAASGVRVINISMGLAFDVDDHPEFCVTQAESDQINAQAQAGAEPFRQLFNGPVGRNVVWTLSAGNNCGEGVHSLWGTSWALPNVVTVAASNSDGTLARFSNFGPGVEVAAPGGVGIGITGGAGGIWSTVIRPCLFGLLGDCSGYEQMMGTSMAAPIVAGVAALAFSADQSASAADVGSCITSTAGLATPKLNSRSPQPANLGRQVDPKITFHGPIPVVDARAVVECVQSGVRHGDVLIAGQGDRTASGYGTDLGDLTAQLESLGYSVVTSRSLPSDLSGFGQIWYIDTEALTEDEQDRMAAYVASGKSAYLTGEWGCCSVDSSSIALINRLVPGAAVAHGGPDGDEVTISPSAPFGLATTPRAVSTIRAATPGSLSGVAPGNVVGYASSPDQAIAAAWGPADVTGGGRLAIVMDINWIAWPYRGPTWSDFVENLAQFLSPSALADKVEVTRHDGLEQNRTDPRAHRKGPVPASALGPR